MALTGKTIGELELLQFPTNDTLLPVEYLGDTYHITFSSITYNEGTYSQFVAEAGNGILTPGRWYLMTDYQAIYDQPNYDNVRNPIFSGNSMTGGTEPLLLLAVSTTGFSPTVYSTSYPQDKITYDITWDTTEISSTPAKGRITERIDLYNNRTDYDHRSILFKRYRGYSYNQGDPLSGLVGISGITGNTAVLYGNTGTTFNSTLSEGELIAVPNLNPWLFEVISVQSDSLATISGVTISTTSDSPFYYANDNGIMSYYQPNVRQNQVYQYTTFGDAINLDGAVNNYIGDYSNLHLYEGVGNFLLANNVFLDGAYVNNTIGDGSYNNTFNDDCNDNQIGPSFYNNSTNDDFDDNIIGANFRDNYITANFDDNNIGYNFNSNTLINSDFNDNRIGNDFNENVITTGSFYRNNIGNSFNGNVITSGGFQNNEIGNQFQNNNIKDEFYKNDIGNGYNNNDIEWEFYGNLIGNGFNVNNIYTNFSDNVIGDYFNDNTIGDSTNIGNFSFDSNRIGYSFDNNVIRNDFNDNDILNDFNNNTIYFRFRKNKIMNEFNTCTIGATGNTGNYFEYNQIMDNFKGNDVQGDFTNNNLKTDFKGNEILDEFNYNNVGYSFLSNNLSGTTIHNNIGDYFEFNNCYGSFQYNTIGTNFYSNVVQDGFGFGGGTYQGNRIGNNFFDNIIGEYFYNNTIPDNFYDNIIGDYFQWNIVDTYVDNVDFTTNYGNITGFSYSSMGYSASDNTYTGIGGQTNGHGINATFDIVVSGGSVTDVTLDVSGNLYVCGNTITILGTSIGGFNNAIFSFIDDVTTQTGFTGSYSGLTATGGTGSNATFDVTVNSGGTISSVVIDNQGFGYGDGEELVIKGNLFGGTDNVDDITITITDIISDNFTISINGVSPNPSVYELYTCNIFKNANLTNRLSYYDASDVLTLKNINE
jgi:hypothetical protein